MRLAKVRPENQVVAMTEVVSTTTVKKLTGPEAKVLIEPFLEKNGSGNAVVRETDLFFAAFCDGQIVGSVRFCIEEKTAMLRTMMIDETIRRRRVGSVLLSEFGQYVDENKIKEVYCLPYSHLVDFYAQIGFRVVSEECLPPFLRARLVEYRGKSSKIFIAMRRA